MRATFRGLGIVVLSAGVLMAPTIVGPTALTAAYAVCLPGEPIDGRTADMAARQLFEDRMRDFRTIGPRPAMDFAPIDGKQY